LLLPAMLRDYAELDKKLVLVGQGNKVEIWSEKHWQEGMDSWLLEGAEALNGTGNDLSGLSV
jgi:MraZ protein